MALTGLQIHKLLPQTNCKECGSNTCLAFAMKLAAKKAELSSCPYASDEAKRVLGAASEPPVRCLELGSEGTLKIGGETCLYRHEKTFVHQTLLAVNLNDTDPLDKIDFVLAAVRDYELERVGERLSIEMLAITQKGKQGDAFVSLAERAWNTLKRPLVLRSGCAEALARAAQVVRGSRSVLASATTESISVLRGAAEENGHILALTAPSLDELVLLSASLKQSGFNDIILEFRTDSLAEQFQVNSLARRAALRSDYKPLGYPTLRFLESADVFENCVAATVEIAKYGGICVLPSCDAAELVSLMTLRQNIYTDPQKPIQVEPKVYPVGEPDRKSAVFLTTNFSLTYFIVSGEIENSGISAWLVVPECEGMSVLTAWAAGKFSGATVAKFVKEIGLESQIDTREIVIPGYVAQISGELEESLPGWRVLVGPQEASDIESFVKNKMV